MKEPLLRPLTDEEKDQFSSYAADLGKIIREEQIVRYGSRAITAVIWAGALFQSVMLIKRWLR